MRSITSRQVTASLALKATFSSRGSASDLRSGWTQTASFILVHFAPSVIQDIDLITIGVLEFKMPIVFNTTRAQATVFCARVNWLLRGRPVRDFCSLSLVIIKDRL